MSVALFYEITILPSFYLFFLGKMRKPRHVSAPRKLRVAIITLCVPSSESIEVIERQLAAMVAVKYPHDCWILDEGNSVKVKALAKKYGVQHFSRRGIKKYNQPNPPFMAKTKAGNVNAWLDMHSAKYDFFVQLDIDHLPCPRYLDKTLGHFADKKVAWVQAPSIYGNHLNSWSARGSSEQELVLQGPLQMGFYGFSGTPFIIGSHCTYRMSSICEIGGFQPTRAEDHLDTVVLASKGYRGVFLPEPIALGDGPESFDIYLAQQFAWAFSMIQVLFYHTPKLLKNYTMKQAMQFLFAQTWYTFWSTSMLVMFLMPVLALVTKPITINMSFLETGMRYLPLPITAFAIFYWSRKWQQPTGLNLSWRGVLLHIARWPVVTWALLNVIFGVQKPYMITPKGMKLGEKPFNFPAHAPYFILSAISFLGVMWFKLRIKGGNSQGYLFFVLQGCACMILVYAIALLTDIKEIMSVKRKKEAIRMRIKPISVLIALFTTLVVVSIMSGSLITQAMTWREFKTPEERKVVHLVHSVESKKMFKTQIQQIDEVINQQEVALVVEETVETETTLKATTPKEELNETLEVTLEEESKQATLKEATSKEVTPNVVQKDESVPVPVELPTNRVAIGAYDPNNILTTVDLDVEHHFVVWYRIDQLEVALKSAQSHGRIPMISLEPWPWNEHGMEMGPITLIEDISAGLYDKPIRENARRIKSLSPQQVIVRWGHEFDLLGLYPWCTENAEGYKNVYRHVVDIFNQEGTANVLWMWSPAGNESSVNFFPGEDCVDIIGITILSDNVWEMVAGTDEQRAFETLLEEKYWLSFFYQKPLFVAEVGISTETSDFQLDWLKTAKKTFEYYPWLKGFVYFNRVNQHAPVNSHYPDYTLTLEKWEEVFGK